MAEKVPESGALTVEQAYIVLEVPDGDKGNIDKVKAQYRKLCMKWHPDKNRDNEEEVGTRD